MSTDQTRITFCAVFIDFDAKTTFLPYNFFQFHNPIKPVATRQVLQPSRVGLQMASHDGKAIAELAKDYPLTNATDGRLVQKYMTRRAYNGLTGPLLLDELGEKIDSFVVSYMNASNVMLTYNINLNVTCWTCDKVEYYYVSQCFVGLLYTHSYSRRR